MTDNVERQGKLPSDTASGPPIAFNCQVHRVVLRPRGNICACILAITEKEVAVVVSGNDNQLAK